MRIQEAEWEECECCGKRKKMKRDEVYGCDTCKKPIDMNKSEADYLDAKIFSQDGSTTSREYCSWKCAIKDLKKVKNNYFIDLPFLKFYTTKPGMRAKDFFALFKKI